MNLFGSTVMTFNCHLLLHLPAFVERLGCLDRFSCFPSESYLSMLKRSIKPTRHIVPHINRKITFLRRTLLQNPTPSIKTDPKPPNNVVKLHNGSIIRIVSKEEEYFSGYVLELVENLYSYPYESSSLGIGLYKKTENLVSSSSFERKCIAYPKNNLFVVFPFCNAHLFC